MINYYCLIMISSRTHMLLADVLSLVLLVQPRHALAMKIVLLGLGPYLCGQCRRHACFSAM